MAIYTIYDLESTGLSPITSNILTMTYASFVGRDIFEPKESGTLYFFKPDWVIPAGAAKINKLTEEIMKPHIPEFRVNCRKMWHILQRGNVVGQNIKNYDNTLVRSFFNRQGYGEVSYHRVMDTRYALGSSMSLDDLIEHFKITTSLVLSYWRMIFPNSLFSEEEILHHNGEYDVTVTTLVWLKLCAQNAKGFEGVV